jgi:Cof subfamily protein (haloacid dehalogenase superfamily)
MKTLYISDLDGTLLQPNVEISGKSIRILNELIEKGMLFSVATARTIASVRPILKDLKVTAPIVLMNGVCIYDPGKNDYIKVETFGEKSKEQLMSVISSRQLKGFAYSIKDGMLSAYYEDLKSKPLWDFYEERVTKYNKKFTRVDSFTSLTGEPLIYFSLIDYKEKLEPIYRIVEAIPDLNCVLYKDNYSPDFWYLEIFSKYASKYHAAQFLRNYLNLDRIVCFGDNRNDLPFFEAGDYKLAVANAVPELKEKRTRRSEVMLRTELLSG